MARQEETCWRCGTQWASEDAPRTRLRVISGGSAGATPGDPVEAAVASAVAITDRR